MVAKKMSCLSWFLLLITIFLYAETNINEVPFDVNRVIEQVIHHPKRDGEVIKIEGRFYEAQFAKDGITLKERNGNKQFKIYFDEMTSDATVADSEVKYCLKDGVLSVKGKNRGLRFQRKVADSGKRSVVSGLRYRLRTEGDAARLSEVIVTDHRGRKIKPEIIKRRNEIELRLSRKQTSNLEFPLTLEGEFMVDTTKVYGPAEDEQWNPAIAFDGTNYLVVWGDFELEGIIGTRVSQSGEVLDKGGILIAEAEGDWEEEGPAVAFGNNYYLVVWTSDADLYGKRVSTNGTVIDLTPITICATSNCYRPAVAYDGSNFLVVWEDTRGNNDIYGARVSPDGTVLDPNGFSISLSTAYQEAPAVGFGGGNYFVAWVDWRNGNADIYGTRVSPAGTVLNPSGIAVSTASDEQYFPAVTFGSGNYFVVWSDYRSGNDLDIYGARVSQAGTVLDPTGIAISTATNYQEYPAVAFDGTNYFAVWSDYRAGGDIYGARVNPAGTVLDPTGVRICTTSVSDDEWLPAIAFGVSNYFVVWMDWRFDGDIFGARVNTSATVLDPNGILISLGCNSQWNPQVAFDGTNYLVVWEDTRVYSDIYGARVSANGRVLDPAGIPICTANYYQLNPKVVFGGGNYLVVWDDIRHGNWNNTDIYGTRVSTGGTVLDPNGIPITTANSYQWGPQVVFGGTNYFVVWIDDRDGDWYFDIYGTRVSTAGTVLDPSGIPISTATYDQWNPRLIFGGTNYFVVWEDSRNGNRDIYGARVNTAGTVLDPTGIAISTATEWQWDQQVVFDGANYFVIWEDNRNSGTTGTDIYGARVTAAGTVLDPSGIPISTANYGQWNPQVVFGGSNYFVVWQDDRDGDWYSDIYGTRVNTAGTVLDPSGIPISTANYDQRYPEVIFDGTDYVVIWEDYRDGDWDSDIYGAKVTTAGGVTEFLVSNLTGDQFDIALAKGSGNQIFIVWTGWTPAPYYSERIWGKLIGSLIRPPAHWTLMKPVPTEPSRKKVKGGGSLVACSDSLIFCLKGNNTRDFYCYTVKVPDWHLKESVPYAQKPKGVKSGAALVFDGDSLIYATKGNNTLEWMCYNILRNTWKQLKPIPSQKGLKGGTGLAKVKKNGIDCIFVLKGSKSKENFLYFPVGDSWQKLPDAPDEFKKGTCATGYEDSIVYVLKDKDNLFYRVNILNGSWTQKKPMPFDSRSEKRKKVKEGSALVADDSITLYAFKGGNTQEFWAYNVINDSWVELETLPRSPSGKRIKAGGALAFIPKSLKGRGEGEIYALKGNNTDEFWMFETTGVAPLFAGELEEKAAKNQPTMLRIVPNPNRGYLTINYNLNPTIPVRIKIYSTTGTLVRQTTIESENNQLKLNLEDLSQGVYILRLETGDFETSQKLIIQK